MTDCLLQAYDCVARRAYQIFLERGGKPGGELDDWLNAERELLGSLSVDLAEGEDYVSALASLPGLSGEEIEIGIDPRWIVILGRRGGENDSAEFDPDPHRVAEFSRAVNADPRAIHLGSSAGGGAHKHGNNAPQRDLHLAGESALSQRAADSLAEQSVPDTSHPAQCNPAPPLNASKLFCVLELPAEVDPERSVAVLANDLLGIRMPKALSPQGLLC